VLDQPMPDVDERHYGRVLAIKQAAAASIFTITARVRETVLRPQNDDGVGKVNAMVKLARAEIAEARSTGPTVQ
jgi:hypothetical protein